MNILFMIGNGFDLNVGLYTRFKDFFSTYLKIPNNDDRIKKFKEEIEAEIETWADFEKQIGVYAKNYNTSTQDDYIYCLDNFLDELINYLRKQEESIDYESNANEIVNVFRDSLVNYQNFLPPYSAGILNSIYDKNRIGSIYSFMSFNYTGVLDGCINLTKTHLPLKDVLHIHGTLDEHPLIGVDNDSQIENSELSANQNFTRLMSKPLMNEGLRNQKHEQGAKLVESSDIICVFGMSLGETDKTWWQLLGKWLLNKKSSHLVLFIFEEDYSKIHARKAIGIVDKIKNHFFDMADFPNDKHEEFEQRIHIGLNTDMFKINLTKTKTVSDEN